MSGPCGNWIALDVVKADPRCHLESGDPIPDLVLIDNIAVASKVLYRLSGRQFAGVCTDMVRPCRRYYKTDGATPPWWRWQQSWGTYSARNPHRDAGSGPLHEITLGAYPLRDILSVRIDGAVVSPATYEIHDRRWLVRTVPEGWPSSQNLYGDPMVDDNTFGVWFEWGEVPDTDGQAVCKTFAIELAKGASGDPCNLPERITSLQMGPGASYALLDPMSFIKDGKTGIYAVDLWLQSVNPNQLKRRSSVINPDTPRPVRRTRTISGS